MHRQNEKRLFELNLAIRANEGVECQEYPELFFPEDAHQHWSTRSPEIAFAKLVCERCPLILQCREYAVFADESYGIWGGMTAQERRAIYATASRLASAVKE